MPNAPVAVSYVMPVLNEAGYLEAAIASIVEQDHPGDFEIVLAVGPSTDGTAEIVTRLIAADDRIRIIDNPGMDIPIGLNLAIAASRHPIIVRVDAHTELAPGYTSRAVATLERTGAASLGGVMVATGKPGLQAAVARAYNSRYGLGGGAYHGESASEGPAESAYMGVMRADALREIGGFDETLRRGEDWELNYRLRQAGHIVWLDPQLRVSYWPRSTLLKLHRQFFATGVWRGELVRRLGARNPLRFFAPPVLLISVVLSVILLPLHLTGVLSGWLGWMLALVYLGPLAYLGLLVVAGVTTPGSFADRVRLAVVLATMHLSWGAGFLVGALRGARDVVDRSRTES
ncbi:MAG: glycosyltransferase family 2 protein [Pseudolysinimonas sp.]|jgi:glycosyltransferase involved in cell wall biosynthesis|uniref:glycosyltransferase family 2 protein n=1 Tax=Pseudolysinimonas sp. TaxID=2680009 RepID=UPI003C732732